MGFFNTREFEFQLEFAKIEVYKKNREEWLGEKETAVLLKNIMLKISRPCPKLLLSLCTFSNYVCFQSYNAI